MFDRNAGIPIESRIQFRIGINLGDIIAEGGDIYGDGVNISARLETLAEPGGICLSRSVRDQVRDRLPYMLDDIGEQSVKNIARPVRAFRISPEAISTTSSVPPVSPVVSRFFPARRAGALLAVMIVLAGGAGWWLWSAWPARQEAATGIGSIAFSSSKLSTGAGGPAPSVPLPRLSIVVLPFTNVGNDPAQEYFADGITDDLTTDLSRIPDSFVISHASAAGYKGKPIDVHQISRDLNVRYGLTGSVRRSGDQVQINAQLVDMETGRDIWAERFADDWDRLRNLQDEVSARLANTLGVQLTQTESQRAQRERPTNPDAIDLAMRGWAALNRPRSPEHTREALGYFDDALRFDPELISALVGKARSLTYLVWLRWSASPATDLEEARTVIAKVIAVSPDNAMAHFVRGDILKSEKKLDLAIAEFETAIENDRNLALAYEALGHAKILLGRSPEAFAPIEKAIRLSPHDPALNLWLFHICHAYTHLAREAEAIPWCRKSVAAGPLWLAYVDLAADNAWIGKETEAHAAVAELLKLMPGYTVHKWATAGFSDNPKFLAEYQRIVEGLRKAGLPEG
jgi:TolB-like protein